MQDPRIAGSRPEDLPSDARRMFRGGFAGLVERGWGSA